MSTTSIAPRRRPLLRWLMGLSLATGLLALATIVAVIYFDNGPSIADVDRIATGMTQAEVELIMGRPVDDLIDILEPTPPTSSSPGGYKPKPYWRWKLGRQECLVGFAPDAAGANRVTCSFLVDSDNGSILERLLRVISVQSSGPLPPPSAPAAPPPTGGGM